MVGRRTVCDGIASWLLFGSPVTHIWCYVLCDARLPAAVLLQLLHFVTGASEWHGVVKSWQLQMLERVRLCSLCDNFPFSGPVVW